MHRDLGCVRWVAGLGGTGRDDAQVDVAEVLHEATRGPLDASSRRGEAGRYQQDARRHGWPGWQTIRGAEERCLRSSAVDDSPDSWRSRRLVSTAAPRAICCASPRPPSDAGWEVHAAVPGPPEGREVWDAFERPGVVRRRLPVGRGHGPGGLAAAGRLLGDFLMTAAAILRVRPDVVFVNLPTPEQSPGAMLATALLRRPTAVVFHLVPPGQAVTPRRRRLYALTGRRQTWIAVSDDSRRELARRLGRPSGQDPPDLQRHRAHATHEPACPDRDEIRHELGISSGRTVLLTVARLSLQKGHDLLLDAMPDLLKRDPGRAAWLARAKSRPGWHHASRRWGWATTSGCSGHATTSIACSRPRTSSCSRACSRGSDSLSRRPWPRRYPSSR